MTQENPSQENDQETTQQSILAEIKRAQLNLEIASKVQEESNTGISATKIFLVALGFIFIVVLCVLVSSFVSYCNVTVNPSHACSVDPFYVPVNQVHALASALFGVW